MILIIISVFTHHTPLIPAYFTDYGFGVVAALLRRAEEGGGWLVRVALAKTAMLDARLVENRETPVPIKWADLERYLVDQESPLGLLTWIAPAIQLDKTPAYVERAASFPGSSTLDIGWGPHFLAPHAAPHRPTRVFRLGFGRMRGDQLL